MTAQLQLKFLACFLRCQNYRMIVTGPGNILCNLYNSWSLSQFLPPWRKQRTENSKFKFKCLAMSKLYTMYISYISSRYAAHYKCEMTSSFLMAILSLAIKPSPALPYTPHEPSSYNYSLRFCFPQRQISTHYNMQCTIYYASF